MLHSSKMVDTDQTTLVVAPPATRPPAFLFPDEVMDSMRHLITRLGRDHPIPNRLSIVAALRKEGVTYVSRSLAFTLANNLGLRVCLVDLNWWYPSDYPFVSPENGGLAAVLTGEAALENVLVNTGWPNLSLLPAGKIERPDRPAWARSQTLKYLLDKLTRSYDHLILDIPAVLATSDAVPLASLGTACCLVVRHGATWMEDVKLTLDEIEHLSISGVVMNKVKLSTPPVFVKLINAR